MIYPKLISATKARRQPGIAIAYHEESEHEVIKLHEALAMQGE